MKRKYYMRGLGVGIIVTAILFTVAFSNKEPSMTEEEIIARAKELGYTKVTEGVTAEDIDKIKDKEQNKDITENPEATPESTGTPEPTPSPAPTPEPPEKPEKPVSPSPVTEPEPTEAPSPTLAPTKKPTVTPVPTEAVIVTVEVQPTSYQIQVTRGMTATKVSQLLANVGAIDDAGAFVSYLRNQRLTDLINIGSFTIPEGASYEEIARILTAAE